MPILDIHLKLMFVRNSQIEFSSPSSKLKFSISSDPINLRQRVLISWQNKIFERHDEYT